MEIGVASSRLTRKESRDDVQSDNVLAGVGFRKKVFDKFRR